MRVEIDDSGAAADRCFEALADERRREVLTVLFQSESSLSLTELAVELTRVDADAREADAPTDGVEHRKVQLYHRHVPKLVDAGLVEFDRDRRTVSLAPEFQDAEDTTDLLAA